MQNLTAKGQKEVEYTQDTCLKLLEAHVQKSHVRSLQRMSKLLLFSGQVKALSKDIAVSVEDKQIFGPEADAAIFGLISQNL